MDALLDRSLQFKCVDRCLIFQRLVALEAIVVGGVGSQFSAERWLTAYTAYYNCFKSYQALENPNTDQRT